MVGFAILAMPPIPWGGRTKMAWGRSSDIGGVVNTFTNTNENGLS